MVQGINVLSDDVRNASETFGLSEGKVASVRFGVGNYRPSDIASRPVLCSSLFTANEHIEGHRVALGLSFAAIIGDS